jgi:hypothetical protein
VLCNAARPGSIANTAKAKTETSNATAGALNQISANDGRVWREPVTAEVQPNTKRGANVGGNADASYLNPPNSEGEDLLPAACDDW